VRNNSKCCGAELISEMTPHSVHYGRYICSNCGSFQGNIPSPKNENKRKKVSRYSLEEISEFYSHEEIFCFFCGRNKKELGVSLVFEREHIVEIQEGGKDELRNLFIYCTSCHAVKTAFRRVVIGGREKDNIGLIDPYIAYENIKEKLSYTQIEPEKYGELLRIISEGLEL